MEKESTASRLANISRGRMGSSAWRSTMMKRQRRTPVRAKDAKIAEWDHGSVTPPSSMGTSRERTMAPKRNEPLKSIRWSFERFLATASVDVGDSTTGAGPLGDDGAGEDGSEDEGTTAGR